MEGRKCGWSHCVQSGNSPSCPLFSLTGADYQKMSSNAQKLPSQHLKGNTISKLLTYDFVPLIDVVGAWE